MPSRPGGSRPVAWINTPLKCNRTYSSCMHTRRCSAWELRARYRLQLCSCSRPHQRSPPVHNILISQLTVHVFHVCRSGSCLAVDGAAPNAKRHWHMAVDGGSTRPFNGFALSGMSLCNAIMRAQLISHWQACQWCCSRGCSAGQRTAGRHGPLQTMAFCDAFATFMTIDRHAFVDDLMARRAGNHAL